MLKTKNNNVQKAESEQKTDKAQKGVVTGSKDPTNNRRGKKRAFSKTDQVRPLLLFVVVIGRRVVCWQ